MNKKIAEFLVRSLLERIESSGTKVFLSTDEASAIKLLFSNSEIEDSFTHSPQDTTESEFTPELGLSLDLERIDTKQIMCLDFGTSFSKAFASRDLGLFKEPELIELHLDYHPDGTPNYLLPSELFIEKDIIYFGASARKKFNTVEADQSRLIDSPKQYMTLGKEVSKLSEKTLHESKDPKKRITQRDALVIYIAHFNTLAEKALRDRGYPENTPRRYTHPAWSKETTDANAIAMRRIVAESITISRAYPDLFSEFEDVSKVKKILQAAEKLDESDLPRSLIKDAVREATAAGSGALSATTEGKREAYVILDIGAGTTDIAGCLCVNSVNADNMRVSEVETASKAFNRAGNFLDQVLLDLIHKQLPYDGNSIEYKQVNADLRRKIRSFKETLFEDKGLLVPLVTGDNVAVSLDDFLNDSRIQTFIEEIKTALKEAAFALCPDGGTVKLVATGGGARLPFISDIANSGSQLDGKAINYRLVDAIPIDLKQSNPDLIPPYPQLAVAAGGSLPSLPKQIASIKSGISHTPRQQIGGFYKS